MVEGDYGVRADRECDGAGMRYVCDIQTRCGGSWSRTVCRGFISNFWHPSFIARTVKLLEGLARYAK